MSVRAEGTERENSGRALIIRAAYLNRGERVEAWAERCKGTLMRDEKLGEEEMGGCLELDRNGATESGSSNSGVKETLVGVM